MYHEGVARELSRQMRDVLLSHIDGPQETGIGTPRFFTVTHLIRRELLFDCLPDGSFNQRSVYQNTRPLFTAMNKDGRHVLCWVLADYADALVRCGALDREIGLKNATLAPEVNALLAELWHRRGHEIAQT